VRILSTLGLLGITLVGLIIAIPILSVAFSLFGALVIFLIWVAPFWIIATSRVTTGFEKIAWLIAMVFLSWFAWVFYFFLAPLKQRDDYYDYSR
jgi:hypothetical protein